MKLVTFDTQGALHVGAMLPGETAICDFTGSDSAAYFHDMLAFMDGGARALDHAQRLLKEPTTVLDVASVRLKAPVPTPRQMFDCLCFEEHMVQSARNGPKILGEGRGVEFHETIPQFYRDFPVYYKPNRFSVIGTEEDIVCPKYSTKLDYELEFGVFVGRTLKNASVDEAKDAIFGYCIYNDVSARDQQLSEMRGLLGPSKGKDFDTGNVLGPWLVTADEIADPSALVMSVFINGDHISTGSSAGMMHSFPEIIAYLTQDETRHAGEFIGSGTVGGGCGLETGRLLQHGDVVELEVSGLGRLRNRVVFQQH